jgi:hypothetical protein
MSNIPDRAYMERRIDQIKAACEQSNGELAVGIVQLITADGYPEFADALTRELIEQALSRMAGAR